MYDLCISAAVGETRLLRIILVAQNDTFVVYVPQAASVFV